MRDRSWFVHPSCATSGEVRSAFAFGFAPIFSVRVLVSRSLSASHFVPPPPSATGLVRRTLMALAKCQATDTIDAFPRSPSFPGYPLAFFFPPFPPFPPLPVSRVSPDREGHLPHRAALCERSDRNWIPALEPRSGGTADPDGDGRQIDIGIRDSPLDTAQPIYHRTSAYLPTQPLASYYPVHSAHSLYTSLHPSFRPLTPPLLPFTLPPHLHWAPPLFSARYPILSFSPPPPRPTAPSSPLSACIGARCGDGGTGLALFVPPLCSSCPVLSFPTRYDEVPPPSFPTSHKLSSHICLMAAIYHVFPLFSFFPWLFSGFWGGGFFGCLALSWGLRTCVGL